MDLTRKNAFFEGWSYTSVEKGLKLKVRKFWGLIPTFVEVTGEKPVGVTFLVLPILNRVKSEHVQTTSTERYNDSKFSTGFSKKKFWKIS